jgi:hypothetical protein
VVTDIRTSLAQQGISALIVVNGHGGNYVLGNVVQQANADGAMRVGLYPSRADWTEAAVLPASAVAATTTCTPANSKRRSCSPLTQLRSRRLAGPRPHRPRSPPSHHRRDRCIHEQWCDRVSIAGQRSKRPCSPRSSRPSRPRAHHRARQPVDLSKPRRGGYRPLTLPSAATPSSRSPTQSAARSRQWPPAACCEEFLYWYQATRIGAEGCGGRHQSPSVGSFVRRVRDDPDTESFGSG